MRLPAAAPLEDSSSPSQPPAAVEQARTLLPKHDPYVTALLVYATRASRLTDLLGQRILREHDLDASQLAMLYALGVTGPPHQLAPARLSAILAQSPSGISRTMQRLERAKLIESVDGADDRRKKLIKLTRNGHATLKRAMHDLVTRFETALNNTNETDLVGLIHAQRNMIALLETMATSPE